MDAKTNIKARLPSRHVTEGPERAPHRSYYYAMGLTSEQIHQPFVGVASCWNEAAPCNIALMRQAQAVKKGVAAARGTPREFCTITVTDGIAMGHAGAHLALDGVSWVQGGSVEIAVGRVDRMLQNRRRHLLPPSGVAPLGSSVGPPVSLMLLGYAGANSVPCRSIACMMIARRRASAIRALRIVDRLAIANAQSLSFSGPL